MVAFWRLKQPKGERLMVCIRGAILIAGFASSAVTKVVVWLSAFTSVWLWAIEPIPPESLLNRRIH